MLILKLNSETEKKAIYYYYPEGKEVCGKVSINKMTGDVKPEASENDEFGRYLMHAVKRVKEYFENGEYKENDMVAWY